MEIKELETKLTELALKVIINKRDGCIFVISDKLPKDCSFYIEQDIKPFSIFDNERRTELLAIQDGATIVNSDGMLYAYAVKLKADKIMQGFSSRHSAALSESYRGNICLLASEEDKKVRIFKDGEMVMQVDALEKGVEKNVPKAIDTINHWDDIKKSIGEGTIGSVGLGLVAPLFGITGYLILPGIILFSVGRFVTRKMSQ